MASNGFHSGKSRIVLDNNGVEIAQFFYSIVLLMDFNTELFCRPTKR